MKFKTFVALGQFQGKLYELIDDHEYELTKDEMLNIMKAFIGKFESVEESRRGQEDDE